MALTPQKKQTIKKVALGMGIFAVLLCIPKVGTGISSAFATVRTKIGG